MVKKLAAVLAAICATVLLVSGSVGTAAAAGPKAYMGGGSGILIPKGGNKASACTLTAVGKDQYGRLTALTAGHCGKPGQQVYAEYFRNAGQIGTITYTNARLDYAVIRLDANRVVQRKTVRGVTIKGIRTNPPGFGEIACKAGRTTGNTCGITWFSDRTAHYSQICIDHGDSGSPVVVGDRLIGMVNAFFAFSCVGPETGTNMAPILRDMKRIGITQFRV